MKQEVIQYVIIVSSETGILNVTYSPYLNILCISSEKPNYAKNTYYF